MSKTLGFLIVLCSTAFVKATATQCFTDAECGQGECCFRHVGPWIVSKRQFLPQSVTPLGVCEKYQVLGDNCSPFDKLNGHCSCGPGLTCEFFPLSSTVPQRRLLAMPETRTLPGHGTFQCAPITAPRERDIK